MIKKLVILCASIASFQTYACNVSSNTSNDVVDDAIQKNGWGFENYDAICEKLRKANAVLMIDGDATVLDNKSVSWASVNLKDKNLNISTNDYGGMSTSTNEYASIDQAKQMLMESINDAVNKTNIDKAIKSLNEARKKVRAAYSR